MSKQIKVFPDIERLNRFAAEKFVEIASASISERGRFSVALSGGSTPRAFFRLLSGAEFAGRFDWSKVFFFFGDERGVLPDDADSNFRMARENLFEPLKIADTNIFRWATEFDDPEKTAAAYAETLRSFFSLERPDEFPRFDLILLGMGADGHTASLFPSTEALRETEKSAVANPVEKLRTIRLTLTFPVINNARNVIFLIAGADKAEPLKTVLEGAFEPDKFPSQGIAPANGDLFWLVEAAAAARLDER